MYEVQESEYWEDEMALGERSTALNDDDILHMAKFAQGLADVAAQAILPHFRTSLHVENKLPEAGFDPVTTADRAAEQAMREVIEGRFPGHGIVGEEYGTKPSQDGPYWVLDPIDGTRAFIAGLPSWGTLIALNDGIQPVLGVVAQPYIGETFLGIHHGKLSRSTLNGKTIRTRDCTALAEAVASTTGLEYFNEAERIAWLRLENAVQNVRYGFDCYAYAVLSAGFIDVIAETNLQPYDVQALIPLIKGAGGVITTWDGEDAQNGGQILAAGDPKIHSAAREILSPHGPSV